MSSGNLKNAGGLQSCPPIVKERKAANGLPFSLLAPPPGTQRNSTRHIAPLPIPQPQQQQQQPQLLPQGQSHQAAGADAQGELPAVRSEPQLQVEASLSTSRKGVGLDPGNFTLRESAIIQDAKRRLALSAEATASGCLQPAEAVDSSCGLPPPLLTARARSQAGTAAEPRAPFTSRSAARGFLHFMSGGAEAEEDGDTRQGALGSSGYGSTSSFLTYGSGGHQVTVAAEDALIAVASRMGVVRQPTDAEIGHAVSRPRTAAIKASMSVSQVSPLGIAFRAFERAVESLGVRDAGLSSAEVVARHIAPATAQLRCRYCDLVTERLQDAPTLYIVHAWQQSFLAMVEAVRTFVYQLRCNLDDVYIWLDLFCVNPHVERGAQDFAAIKEVIQASDRMLVVLDRHGSLLGRTWCVWEVWQASLSERFDKLVVLTTSWAVEDLLHAYLTLDINASQAGRERERQVLLAEMTRAVDPGQLAHALRDTLLQGAKREMQRAEKLASVNPKRFGNAATTYAMLLSMHSRYGEAEETMRVVMRLYDKSPAREVGEHELASAAYQLACILRDQGRLPDAERVLQEFVNQFRGSEEELYMDGVAALADILTQRKFYTKAEMLGRKMLEEKVKVYGKHHHQVVRSMLQLANIAVAQKLFEEAEQHLREVLTCVAEMYRAETADSAEAYHMMALCTFHSNRLVEAKQLCDKALQLRLRLFGPDHPHTLDSKAFQAEMLIRERRPRDAEQLLAGIVHSRLRSYGVEHHASLSSLGQLADLLRDLHRDDEADEVEQRIIAAGRQLLRYTKIDKFRSLSWVTSYLARRDHLLDKAAMFLAKAYIVFKEKLSGEHELTVMTKGQLMEIIDKVKWIGSNALEQAQIFTSATQFGVAEVMFKQAYSISKLVSPEADHKPLAQGLADALFGQGKVQEAKTIMRAAGLTRKGMKQNMPASYLRWLNTRVAKYMDRAADEEEDGDA